MPLSIAPPASVEWFNQKDNNQRTPLHLAVWNNHKNCVLFLLSINVDKNAQDKGGYTPLYFAVYRGYEAIVLILMEHHCDCTIPSYMQESHLTPLNQACVLGHTTVIRLLLGLDKRTQHLLVFCHPMQKHNSRNTVVQRTSPQHTPDDAAGFPTETPAAEPVSIEKRLEGYVNDPDMNNNTPLISAIRNRHLEAVTLLLQMRANPACTDKHGDTALHIAVNGSCLPPPHAPAEACSGLAHGAGPPPPLLATCYKSPQQQWRAPSTGGAVSSVRVRDSPPPPSGPSGPT